MDVPGQGKNCAVFLTMGRNRLDRLQRTAIVVGLEVGVSEVVSRFVGSRVRRDSVLEVLNGFGVEMVAGQQDAGANGGSGIATAHLVEPLYRLARVIITPQLQVGLSKQIEVARLIRMFLRLLRQLLNVNLGPFFLRKARALVPVLEEMLERVGP